MIEYQPNTDVTNDALNALYADAWPDHTPSDFADLLSHNLGHICAISDGILIGFTYVAWDGGAHAFLLDPMVRKDFRRQGVGTQLVQHAAELAREAGVEWLHVDYESHLATFYSKCGFMTTEAGLINLKNTEPACGGDV